MHCHEKSVDGQLGTYISQEGGTLMLLTYQDNLKFKEQHGSPKYR